MNKLSVDQRSRVVSALMEGSSINSTVRMTGVSKPTILKLIADLGSACARYHDDHVRNVKSRRIQVDEVWARAHTEMTPARLALPQCNIPRDRFAGDVDRREIRTYRQMGM
jgi:hypothetical protein